MFRVPNTLCIKYKLFEPDPAEYVLPGYESCLAGHLVVVCGCVWFVLGCACSALGIRPGVPGSSAGRKLDGRRKKKCVENGRRAAKPRNLGCVFYDLVVFGVCLVPFGLCLVPSWRDPDSTWGSKYSKTLVCLICDFCVCFVFT